MPTVEDYFDDDTDIPLPSSSKPRNLPNTGIRGALLEEINSDDENEIDYNLLAEQSHGGFGEDAKAPPPSSGKGKMTMREDPGELRPSGGAPQINPNTPMGGFMGDMMKLQQAEEERMERLKKQFGAVSVSDPSVYKEYVDTTSRLGFRAHGQVERGVPNLLRRQSLDQAWSSSIQERVSLVASGNPDCKGLSSSRFAQCSRGSYQSCKFAHVANHAAG